MYDGNDGYDALDQAYESDERSLSYDHDMSGSVPNLGYRHLQVKPRTAQVPSRSDKTLAFYLDVKTNIARLMLSLQQGSYLG